MKTTPGIGGGVVVVLAVGLTFAHFHGRSTDRARLINSANVLSLAYRQWQQMGTMTTTDSYTRIYPFTNRVTVDGTEFSCALAADVPGLTNAGLLVAATNGTLIWIDSRDGASIVRGQNRRIMMPKRFRDF